MIYNDGFATYNVSMPDEVEVIEVLNVNDPLVHLGDLIHDLHINDLISKLRGSNYKSYLLKWKGDFYSPKGVHLGNYTATWFQHGIVSGVSDKIAEGKCSGEIMCKTPCKDIGDYTRVKNDGKENMMVVRMWSRSDYQIAKGDLTYVRN